MLACVDDYRFRPGRLLERMIERRDLHEIGTGGDNEMYLVVQVCLALLQMPNQNCLSLLVNLQHQ